MTVMKYSLGRRWNLVGRSPASTSRRTRVLQHQHLPVRRHGQRHWLSPLLAEKVKVKGNFGAKTGQGFFSRRGRGRQAIIETRNKALLRALKDDAGGCNGRGIGGWRSFLSRGAPPMRWCRNKVCRIIYSRFAWYSTGNRGQDYACAPWTWRWRRRPAAATARTGWSSAAGWAWCRRAACGRRWTNRSCTASSGSLQRCRYVPLWHRRFGFAGDEQRESRFA